MSNISEFKPSENKPQTETADKALTQHEAADVILKQINHKRDTLANDIYTLENARHLIQSTLKDNAVMMLELLTYQQEYGMLTDEIRAKHIDAVLEEMVKRGVPIKKAQANGQQEGQPNG